MKNRILAAKMAMVSLLVIILSVTGTPSFAQGRTSGDAVTVSGTILDDNGFTLPGATVQIKGTAFGVNTDIDGQYSIKAKLGDVLVFSFMGMISEERTVSKASVINVALQTDTQLLEEAVSIGYGTQQRSLITNSITKVTSKEFEYAPNQNAIAQLQGKVPGLQVQNSSGQPGANPSMFIRGGTTTGVTGDTPLLIVDGVVSQGFRSISDMNPADIESMEVLKDAASTAIYGASAANGIIIVTTKSGAKGKAKVNFKYTFGIDNKPKTLNMLNARDYVYYSRKALMEDPTCTEADVAKFLNGSFGMSVGNKWDTPNTLDYLDTWLAEYGQDFVSNLLENRGYETMIDPVTGRRLIFQDNNFQNATYQTALKHDYSFSVSGGNDKMDYYASLRHLNQDGTVRGTWYKNYSAAFNGSYKVSDSWKVFTKASLNVGDRNNMSNAVNSLERAMFMPPTYRIYYEDGTPAPGEGMSSFRPLQYENYYKNKYNVNTQYRMTFQFGAVWDILPGLKFTPTIYYNQSEGITASFEALNETTGTAIRPASENHQHDHQFQADAVLSYEKTFAKKHHVVAVAGASYDRDYESKLSGSGSGASTDLIPTLNATADSTQRISSKRVNEAMLSYFGRVNYDYKGKYLLSASIRADGSSKFAQNNSWGYFPGASIGWNMHKEPFFKPVSKVMSKFKIRGSWGRAGNNNLSLANSRGRYSVTGSTYLGEVGILENTLGNADLVWETTESFDAGVDMDFFGGRLGFIVDVYNKVTYDRLYDNKLPSNFGFSSIKCNYGSIGTKGIELELSAVPISTKDFTWNLNFNFTYYRSIVLSLPDNGEYKNRTGGNYIYDPKTGTDIKVGGFAEGERFGSRYAYHYLGVYQTDEEAAAAPYDEDAKGRVKHAGDAIWEDRNNDGVINVKDMVFMGYIRPDKTGGLTNEFRYKNFSARVVMDFAMGHVIDNGTLGYSLASIRNNYNTLTQVITDCWTPDNPDAKYPRYSPKSDADYATRNFTRTAGGIGSSTKGQTNNSAFYEKGDYLAFREITLSYNLPQSLLKKIRISGLQIFGGVYNLGYLTAYKGMMPELYGGYDYGYYPRPRQVSAGINISF